MHSAANHTNKTDAKRVGIVGAGPAGLAAAYDLARAGMQVVIFEAGPQVGGLAAGFKAPHWDWTLEKFYHHWFATDSAILGLIDELGWRDQVLFPRPYTVAYVKGKFEPLDSPLMAIRFFLRNYPLTDMARFGLATLYLRLTPWWQPLEKVTAAEWARRWYGPRLYELLWRPLLVGKFGEDNLNVVNMAWLWARLHARTTRLGTFIGGFQAFMDKLAEVVRGLGAEIRLNGAVTGIQALPGGPPAAETRTRPARPPTRHDDPRASPGAGRRAGGASVRGAGRVAVATASGSETFDAVISTSSPALMAKLAPDLPADYSASLQALKSMGAVVMVLALDRQLTNYYWHNIPKEAGFPFLALVEHTNYMSPEHYGGDHLVYIGDYLDPSHEHFRLSPEELLERFLPSLPRFNPAFERSWIKQVWLWKTPYAQPVPPVNHSRNIPPIRTPVPGLYFASMSQVYPWDRGTNFAVEMGRKVAGMVREDLSTD